MHLTLMCNKHRWKDTEDINGKIQSQINSKPDLNIQENCNENL